jgi:hypothetical protein
MNYHYLTTVFAFNPCVLKEWEHARMHAHEIGNELQFDLQNKERGFNYSLLTQTQVRYNIHNKISLANQLYLWRLWGVFHWVFPHGRLLLLLQYNPVERESSIVYFMCMLCTFNSKKLNFLRRMTSARKCFSWRFLHHFEATLKNCAVYLGRKQPDKAYKLQDHNWRNRNIEEKWQAMKSYFPQEQNTKSRLY